MKKILLTGLGLLLCAAAALAQTAPTLILPVPRTLSSIPVLELDGKTFAGQTLKVEFFDDHALAFAGLLSGKTALLMTGFTVGANHGFTAADVVYVKTPVWGVSSLVALDPKLKTLADFAGKTILVPFAKSPLELQLLAILKANGQEGKVKIDYAPITQQVPLLLQKKADGICVPEPLVSKLVTQNGAFEVASFAKLWAPLNGGNPQSPQVSLFAKADQVAKLKPVLDALLPALEAATLAVQKDPAAAAKKYAAAFGLTPELLARGLANTLLALPPAAQERQLVSKYFELLGETRRLSDSFFYPAK